MASAVVGSLRVILGLDTAEFEAGSREAQKALAGWSKDFGKIGQQATALGGTLTAALTVPIMGIAAGSVKAAMDFETAFANVRKTSDGTKDQLDALALSFRKMAKEIPITTDELSNIAALGAQMGVGVDKLENFTKHVAALGVAVDGISTEEAAAGLAQIGNIAGTGTDDIEKMASSLVHLGNNSNATEADILEFTKRLMGAGHSAGMTVPQVMAIGTAMADVGLNAEAGGTAMSTMITKMSKAVSMGGESLKAFDEVVAHTGKSFTELWKGSPVEAVDAVVQGLSKMQKSGVDLNLVVGDIGATNIRTAATMKQLAGAGDGVSSSLKTANEGWSTGNKHLEEAEKKYATTANQLKLLWNAVKDVGITLGNAMLPAIQSAVHLVGALLPLVDGVAKAFAAMPAPLQLGALAFAAVLAAVGPLLLVFGQLAFAAQNLTLAFTAQGIATKGLAASMGLLQTAMGFFVPALLAVAAAIAGWQVGKAIGEVTGLTGVIQNLTEKIMGYRDASEPLESQQKLINQAIKLGAAEGINYADAMAFLQKRAAELRASSAQTTQAIDKQKVATHEAGLSTKEAAKAIKDKEKADKAAEKAAAELTQELERQKAAMHALGITTKQDVNEEMGKLLEGFSLAIAAGVPLKTAMGALVLKLQDLAKRAKESNAEVDELTSGLRQLQTQMLLLDPIPAKLMGKTDFSVITKGLQSVNLETAHASFLSRELWDAYDALGIKTTASLKKQAEEARTAYGLIAASGTATRDQLLEARQAVLDAEIAAGERTVGIWEGTIKPAVLGVMEGIVDSVSAGLVDMIGHWNRAGDIFKDIWQGVKNSFLNVLDDMLSSFLNNFLKGLLRGIVSARLGEALANSLLGGGGGLIGAGGAASGVPSITTYGAGAGYGGGVGAGGVTAGTIAGGALSGVIFMEALAPGFFQQVFTDFWGHEGDKTLENVLSGMAYSGITDPYEYGRMNGISDDVISALIGQGAIPGYSMGTMGQYVDFGAGTLAMLHGREKITPEGASIDSAAWGGGAMTVQLIQDGRKTAQWLVPYIPEEVFRLELA